MSVWFEGENEIGCDLDRVAASFDQLGAHFVGVVSQMPGMIGVELIDETPDSVTIRTNEGTMTRTNIVRRTEPGRVVVEFDEEYQAGSRLTTNTHFVHEFTAAGDGVRHRVVVSDLVAPGLLGFLYRRFGSGRMGKAFLGSYKAYLES